MYLDIFEPAATVFFFGFKNFSFHTGVIGFVALLDSLRIFNFHAGEWIKKYPDSPDACERTLYLEWNFLKIFHYHFF